jgi:aspartyl-tRNA synthetase
LEYDRTRERLHAHVECAERGSGSNRAVQENMKNVVVSDIGLKKARVAAEFE